MNSRESGDRPSDLFEAARKESIDSRWAVASLKPKPIMRCDCILEFGDITEPRWICGAAMDICLDSPGAGHVSVVIRVDLIEDQFFFLGRQDRPLLVDPLIQSFCFRTANCRQSLES